MFSIGLMSGTSMDGIDVALLRTDGEKVVESLGHLSLPHPPEFRHYLRVAERAVFENQGDLALAGKKYLETLKYYCQNLQISKLTDFNGGLAEVIAFSTLLHATAVKKLLAHLNLTPADIDVVGFHGQTLFHQPVRKISVIVGDGQVLANHLQIRVVNDFRSADIAAGGEGAPFAPLYHLALARRDQRTPAVIVNCGGIANLTYVPSTNEHELLAFDTGPGNALIDRIVRERTQGREHFDEDGHYGLTGKIYEDLLGALYAKAVNKQGRKSLDTHDLYLIPELSALSLEDACATLEAFTADTIVQAFCKISSDILPKQWILAGGGWKNPVIKRELLKRLERAGHAISVFTADEIGWSTDALEAEIFAYFAVRSLKGLPLSMPKTTAVPYPLTGGRLYLPA